MAKHPVPTGATAAGKPKFKIDFATLDVTDGRNELKRRIDNGEKVRVLVVVSIMGGINVGRDDGESREFIGDVEFFREMSDSESAQR